jgi:tetratricopeptide (TPR) repeat protein
MRIALTLLLVASFAGAADLERGKELLKEGKFKEAEAELFLQSRKETGSAEAHLLLGLALMKQRDFQRAEAVLREAKELDPKNAEGPTLLGWLYLEGLRDPRRAVPEFEAAAVLSPHSPEAHNNLGTAFDRVQQFDRAIESYSKAIGFKPDYPEALSNRGWASLHHHDHASAREDFLRALAFRRNDAGALLGLATLAKDRGDMAESASAYRKLVATSPNFVYVMDLLEIYVRRYWLLATSVLVMCWVGLSVQRRKKLHRPKEE